jgi:DNA-binding NarL/FixJ family response regulator
VQESGLDGGGDGWSAGVEGDSPTVALVCGDQAWEHALVWLLRSSGVEIVGRVRDLDRAADLVARAAPAVLLVDVDEELAPSRLIRRIRDLRQVRPSTRVVVVCSSGDHPAHDAALVGGADAVVWRENAFDLLRAVDAATQGGDAVGERPQLTLRELEILRLVAEGRTNREVARAVWVTEQTVKYHLANIYRRLGVRSRAEASAWAAENGVVARAGVR